MGDEKVASGGRYELGHDLPEPWRVVAESCIEDRRLSLRAFRRRMNNGRLHGLGAVRNSLGSERGGYEAD